MEICDDMLASLEKYLEADTDGKLRQQIVTTLAALQQQMAVEARKLQSPQNFKAIEATKLAVQSAILVMAIMEQ